MMMVLYVVNQASIYLLDGAVQYIILKGQTKYLVSVLYLLIVPVYHLSSPGAFRSKCALVEIYWHQGVRIKLNFVEDEKVYPSHLDVLILHNPVIDPL